MKPELGVVIKKSDNDIVIPFLKWAGGKRWLHQKLPELFQHEYNRYIEPFLGGGSVFFHLKPACSVLNDLNPELINTYTCIRDDWERVVNILEKHQSKHEKNYYYDVRSSEPTASYERAARFIYLNRTCWNGLYRVNKKGKFNVPMGSKTKVIMNDNFEYIAKLLKSSEIQCSDFEQIVDEANENDLVFIDPPYTVHHNMNGFIKYNQTLFSWDDQIRLRDAVVRAKNRGAKVIVTNAAHESVIELYDGIGEKHLENRASVISGSNQGRGVKSELVVKCF